MAIRKIEKTQSIKSKSNISQPNKKIIVNNTQMHNSIQSTSIDSKLLQKYYVNFGASKKSDNRVFLENSYTQDSLDIIDNAAKIAQEHSHSEITELHIEKASLKTLQKYITDLESGDVKFNPQSSYRTPFFFTDMTTPSLFKDKEERTKIKPVIQQEIESLDRKLKLIPKANKTIVPVLQDRLVTNIINTVKEAALNNSSDITAVPVDDAILLDAIYEMNPNEETNDFRKFITTMNEVIIKDSRKPEEKISLRLYDKKAQQVLKNLALDTNMLVVYDKNTDPMYLVDTVADTLNESPNGFRAIKKENTDIHILNDNMTEEYLSHKVNKLGKDKERNHIIVFNLDDLVLKSAKLVKDEDGNSSIEGGLGSTFFEVLDEPPKNVKIIILEQKDAYFANMKTLSGVFDKFGEVHLPAFSANDTMTAIKEKPAILSKIKKPFTPDAIKIVIEETEPLTGAYPKKVLDIMKRIAATYSDQDKISATDVKKYMVEARDLFKKTENGNSVEVIYDTGIKLKDILGKEATKKEATSIVKQIRKGLLGTKGAIIYSQDGSVGSGRKFTAKAIAGELKSPYLELNAMDFGTKEVDILNGTLSPELAIKKLFSIVKTQADANPHKSAVLFIENFEYFSVGDLISPFHQKAMSQLLREMDNASEKGLNILVLGSVSNPELIGDSTIKSCKFIDKIEVESPSQNIDAREEILTQILKKRNLKIAGNTEPEQKAVVKLMAETTDGFPFVYLANLVDKIKTVGFELGNKKVTQWDVIEAYLQLTTGRPASGPITLPRKKITASHEFQHSINLEYMWSLANKQGIPWHLPERVNFITLDPRGLYSGAMYPKYGGNEEMSLEKVFANLVCDFGGYSAEKHYYNIDGSYGITQDLSMATRMADMAVGLMGQGHSMGKSSIDGMIWEPSQKTKELLEKDRNVLLENARLVSDLITKAYETFNQDLTNKYAEFVGTGNCLIHGDIFREEMKTWTDKQSPKQLKVLRALDETIFSIIEKTKKGKKFNLKKDNVPKEILKLYSRLTP